MDLRILYDKTVAEIFACEGSVCISALYFPKRPGTRGMFFNEESVTVKAEIAQLESVWK